ncbi:MAG: sigma-70 family polymerase sigma factor [Flavipsychrobacter sp.]|nr:sigma-70 family polymerase sigma factor [Flavipsychrobacter sp.]
MNSESTASKTVLPLIGSLTRSESGKLVAVLTRIFGTHNLSLAEDTVQDVLIKAIEHWTANGVPDNPSAWLFTAARNKAIDTIRKYRRQKVFATDITELLASEYTVASTLNDCFRNDEIQDDQLRMMFACCHPAIAREGQIALIMKTLCGFSIAQIARAFITSTDTIEKRLYRARNAFREHNSALEIPTGDALQSRLANVLETIYLLFNEAHSTSYHSSFIRQDLAHDTIRLCTLLTANAATRLPQTDALLALLYFHTSRLCGRTDEHGDLVLLKDQPRSLWDRDMIEKGMYHLAKAATGTEMSRYHLEAAIAYEHCKAAHYEDTDWKTILSYYDVLARLMPSQVILLNRAVVIKELQGAAEALECIRKIPGIDYLNEYYLLHAILGELNMELGKKDQARTHYEKAHRLCASDTEKRFIRKKIEQL